MAIPLLDTLSDLLSASSGALVGAVVTGLFHRGRNRELSERVMAGQQELERQQLENQRLLDIIKDKESFILEMQERMFATTVPAKSKPAKRKKKA